MTILEKEKREKGNIFVIARLKNNCEITVVTTLNHVNVINKNAINRVWRGMGKTFESFLEAKKHYKTKDIKEVIQYAEDFYFNKLEV